MIRTVTARAHANIALVKYWGKRDAERNLPAAGSLSLTLGALTTITSVGFDAALADDQLDLDGRAASGADLARTSAWLDLVRARAGIATRARVVSANHFPTASGLASSASGFAALAVAASHAAGLALSPAELSVLARLGSGSAARSIFGGLVRMHAGDHADGHDAVATPIPSPLAGALRMVIAIVGGGVPKTIGSRDAMQHCAETSPYYRAWIDTAVRDLAAAEAAIAAGDVAALGELTEGSALAMHAAAIASRPTVLYWQPATLAAMATVRALRAAGRAAWATMDAGPHVKVLTVAEDAGAVEAALAATPGVSDVLVSAAGGGAEVVPDGEAPA
ncbi:MAG: diphosphomevalonate decarboxylase [Kofleriaceae bacterium]|nr:diphosphomevalonate decarboxylase [Kofleriaceae bacterium]